LLLMAAPASVPVPTRHTAGTDRAGRTPDPGASRRRKPVAAVACREPPATTVQSLHQWLKYRGTKAVVTDRSNRKQPFGFEKKAYKQRPHRKRLQPPYGFPRLRLSRRCYHMVDLMTLDPSHALQPGTCTIVASPPWRWAIASTCTRACRRTNPPRTVARGG